MASREDLLKRLSLQALKLVEDFSQNFEVDMSETFEPFFQEWESVHELAGIPVDEGQKETLEKLRRPLSVPPQFSSREDSEDEFLPEMLDAGPMRRFGTRRFSFGSENSLDVRDRKRSYEASMDTVWSSSSTFSLNIDNRDEEYDENAGIFIDNVLGSGRVFVGGSEPNLLDGRSREGTLSSQDYPNEEVVEAMDTSLQVTIIAMLFNLIQSVFTACTNNNHRDQFKTRAPNDKPCCVRRRKNALLMQIGVEIVWDNVD